MSYGRVGRIYVPAESGGAYHIEDGELCHTPMLADGRIEWKHPTAVDFWSIDLELCLEARQAGRLLCKRLGYSPSLTAEVLHEE